MRDKVIPPTAKTLFLITGTKCPATTIMSWPSRPIKAANQKYRALMLAFLENAVRRYYAAIDAQRADEVVARAG